MNCPFCSHEESKVVDSRPTEEGQAIRRRRECSSCKKRFTTYEKIEELPLIVIKKGGTRESYNRSKVMNGIIRSCEKRPVSLQDIEKIVDDIEKTLYNSMEKEISTNFIGELVMDKLKKTDEVAYVRFASVYREFKDISTFMEELNKLIKDPDTSNS
ncbi:transcriptional regulator NrdR [Isachenkonia alkalipeptolytica]|uniref:Transcriptional repressor NrdR n=1 Tax=Isachenkonia alkalipeptolytica TaxID=2565777 RepID=A0AA44BFH5_9CLOT|nr:transcriptional regulator NrdR [Isachenkonia alkalipeptolytica]NBG88526.1 transcriptional regulator NrdR [Isachenkonia alkalipeptolytica]